MNEEARLLGRNRLLEKVGLGGIGAVYRASDTRTGATVAVKVLHPHLAEDPEYVRRFRRGAEIGQRLRGQHVVRILSSGQEQGQPHLVMEFVEGKTLAQRMHERGTLSEPEGRTIATYVAQALAEAYEQDIVHRDISPGNILLSKDGIAKVSDFDTARVTDATRMTGTGMFIGKVRYAAPETYGGASDIRSDIYSLGVVIYEMLRGCVPFEADTPLAVMELQRTRGPAGLEELEGLGDGTLGRVVRRCLSKQPDERPQSPQALLAAPAGEVSGDATLPLPSKARRRSGRARLRPLRGRPVRYLVAGGGVAGVVMAVLVTSMTLAGGSGPKERVSGTPADVSGGVPASSELVGDGPASSASPTFERKGEAIRLPCPPPNGGVFVEFPALSGSQCTLVYSSDDGCSLGTERSGTHSDSCAYQVAAKPDAVMRFYTDPPDDWKVTQLYTFDENGGAIEWLKDNQSAFMSVSGIRGFAGGLTGSTAIEVLVRTAEGAPSPRIVKPLTPDSSARVFGDVPLPQGARRSTTRAGSLGCPTLQGSPEETPDFEVDASAAQLYSFYRTNMAGWELAYERPEHELTFLKDGTRTVFSIDDGALSLGRCAQ